MTLAPQLLPCPFCGSIPDLDASGEVSCPVGLCSQDEHVEYAERGLDCGNDSIMTVDQWQKRINKIFYVASSNNSTEIPHPRVSP
jgi:hypothetical protein